MNTRHAEDGTFSQERFCSAEEFSRGILANLVAKRCELLKAPEDRELIWELQLLSHREGFEKLAADLVQAFPDEIGTKSMKRFGMKPGQKYTPDQVKAIRDEIPGGGQKFLLDGEESISGQIHRLYAKRECRGLREIPGRPDGYRVEQLLDVSLVKADYLPKLLTRLCVDPEQDLETCAPWYFKSLVKSLRSYLEHQAGAIAQQTVVTEVGKKVCDSLDYCLQSGLMTVVEGASRTGKSFSAKSWCEQHPGRARYVQVPSTGDEIGFFRKISEAIGSASALSMKGVQLRERVEATLQSSKLMLVLDEAAFLWPQNNRREALPGRINWLMTALVNYGVPVTLVTTPQFARDQKIVERKTGWTSEQFIGRIGHYEKLPQRLSKADLMAVARYHLPKGNAKAIETLALYAQASAKYLAAIETTVKRAAFLANREGRAEPGFEDIKSAIGAVGGRPAGELQPDGSAVAAVPVPPGREMQPALPGRNTSPLVVEED